MFLSVLILPIQLISFIGLVTIFKIKIEKEKLPFGLIIGDNLVGAQIMAIEQLEYK